MPLAIRSRLRRLEQLDSLLGDRPKVPKKSREYTPAMVDALQEVLLDLESVQIQDEKACVRMTQDSISRT